MRRLADPGLHAVIGARARGARRALSGPAVVVALALIALALARPQWNPTPREVTRHGRDVVFLIDVSRSMLARDLAPDRLGRAKVWVGDLVGSIEGDRVALVAFAGAAVVKCPLTLDHAFFALTLAELSPESVPVGGTNIGDAIRKVMADVFAIDPDAPTSHRDIILITDGEDQQSLPVDAAAAAGRAGVRIIALGLGSDESGATIPVEDRGGGERQLTYQGRTVQSRQDSGQLAQIAAASAGGVYLNVGTGTINLDRVYADLVGSAAQATTAESTAMKHDEGFQWLLLPAVLVLAMEGLLRDRSR
jgi:Ca-activated chloride channel family protein